MYQIEEKIKNVEFKAELVGVNKVKVSLDKGSKLVEKTFDIDFEGSDTADFWGFIDYNGDSLNIRIDFDEIWCVGIYGLKDFEGEKWVNMEDYIQINI